MKNTNPKTENNDTRRGESAYKETEDAGFDCGSSRSMLETIQLLKLSKGETRKI